MNILRTIKTMLLVCLLMAASSLSPVHAQKKTNTKTKNHFRIPTAGELIIKYGVASYYAAKFHGRKTASGEIFRNDMITAACNVLPLNTWIKVTNLANNSFIIARINDRLHPQNKRLVDLSKAAAQQLGYVSDGLTKVKVEVLENYKPDEG